ncbi:MAG: ribulose-phosphate 3-epimerase [Christensenellales bacterium]
MTEILVAPSILSADFAYMGDAVKNLKKWGADWVHCDVMDGKFVPNITFGMPMVKALRKETDMVLDVHLMIDSPQVYIPRFIQAGADVVTFHAETCPNTAETLDYIRSQGKKAGLVLNPDIAVDTIIPYIEQVDVVMLMGVFPGFGGQKFIESVMDKIDRLKELSQGRFLIELDGGVTVSNVKEMVQRGVDVVVAGSSVFGAADPAQAVKDIKNCLN